MVLLAAGLALRTAAQIAYQPALIYVDTLKYLYGASPGADPLGYTLVLRAILVFGSLSLVALAQHVLGLAVAVALYAVLLRRGTIRWLAAVAVAPVLLDAYQVQIEQTIMPDVWFEAMIVAGLALLLWRPAVTVRLAAAAGLILGLSATVHQVGELLIVPVALYLLVAAGQLRRAVTDRGRRGRGLRAAGRPYCGASYVKNGHFWLARTQSTAAGWSPRPTALRSPSRQRCGRSAPPRPSRRRARTGSRLPSTLRCTRRPSRPGRTGPG